MDLIQYLEMIAVALTFIMLLALGK